jgi:hypothetical protein
VAISTYAAYLAKIDMAQRAEQILNSTSRISGNQLFWSQWTNSASSAGVAPSTAVVPDRTTVGSLGQTNASATGLRLSRATMTSNSASPFGLVLCDRLSHQGGLSGTTTGAQTTNLPTAALTRSTDGLNVMAAVEIYAQIGATAQTFTCSYTNQAGTASRTSIAVPIGGTSVQEVLINKFQVMTLQAGDLGVKSVESLTLSASTGTAGNFGVTLFRPIMTFPGVYDEAQEFDAILGLGANMHLIPQDACLFWLVATTTGTIPGHCIDVKLIEDALP